MVRHSITIVGSSGMIVPGLGISKEEVIEPSALEEICTCVTVHGKVENDGAMVARRLKHHQITIPDKERMNMQ